MSGDLPRSPARSVGPDAPAQAEPRSDADRFQDLRAIADSALVHLDVDSLLHELLARVRARLHADSATILLLTEDGDHLRIRASSGRAGEVIERLRVPIGRGIAGRIAAAGGPLSFEDLSGEEVLGEDLREQTRSILGAPMIVGGRTTGVIHVGSAEVGHFTPDDASLLEFAAERAAVALENWRLYEAEQRARQRWETAAQQLARLSSLIAKLGACVTEAETDDVIVSEAMPFLGATGLWIYLLDRDSRMLHAVAVRGYPNEIEALLRVVSLSADHPSARSARSGEAQFIGSSDELVSRYPDFVPLATKLRPGAAAALPLAVGDRPFGSIVLQWDGPRGFDEQERSFLSALAVQVAQAYERSRLYESERRARATAESAVWRTAILQQLTSSLSAAPTVRDVAEAVMNRGLRAVGASAGAVFALGPSGETIDMVGDYGYSPEEVEAHRYIPVASGLPVAEAFRSGRPVLFENISVSEAGFSPAGEIARGDHALAALPLLAGLGGGAIGSLSLTFPTTRSFGADEIGFITALADQCALALERARLHDLERRERKRAAFLDALGELLARSLNYERTLAKVAKLAVHGVDTGGELIDGLADWCAIDLLQPDGTILLAALAHRDPHRLRLGRALRERRSVRWDEDTGVAWVLRTGRSELLAAVESQSIWTGAESDDEPVRALAELQVRSAITVPLTARGRTFGAIEFLCQEDRPYTRDDLAFAEHVAERASVAIDNARLYRDRAEIARTLQRALKPQDPSPVPGIDLATRYLAAGEGVEVGGDFYEVWGSADEGLWVAIGDVTGKGPSAVDLNLLARHTIRTAAMRGDPPERILRTLNRALLERESRDRFCTAVVCRMDVAARPVTATVACGGHPLPIVLRGDGALERVGEPGTLLGVFPDVDIAERRFSLRSGDTLVLYTDGVIEERSGAGQFGVEGLTAELATCVGRSAEETAVSIERAVRAVRKGELLDDVALVVLRPLSER